MLIIGEKKDSPDWRCVRMEPGDSVIARGGRSFWTTTKGGLKECTDKVHYPDYCGILFLGGRGGVYWWCLDARWAAAALKACIDDLPEEQLVPFEDEAEARDFIKKYGRNDPEWAELAANWRIYPKDQWKSI